MPDRPNKIQRDHSAKLSTAIKQTIHKNGGWISFEQYMNMALYEPGLGYYSAGANKLGLEGDFITSSSLGKQFAHCLAKQCHEIQSNLEPTHPGVIVEFGAGTGQLALDILEYLDNLDHLPQQYLIVEISADFQQRQKQLIKKSRPDLSNRVGWLDHIPDQGICGTIIANELLDALPVKRFELDQQGQARELGISLMNEEFIWQLSYDFLPDFVQERLNQFHLPSGYQSEIGGCAETWVRSVGECLISGAMILIDYGFPETEFYHWDRTQGTLMCHYQHTAHSDPFFYPGIQDITAHVDFSAVANAAADSGLALSGYCNQGSFLLSLGMLENLAKLQNNDGADANMISNSIQLTQEVKKLTLPHEMGELFKVIALTKNYTEQLSGFKLQNHRGKL